MDAALYACAASALLLTGVAWFVQVVHYPLFGSIGPDRFLAYHEAHSRLTTRVVLVPMVAELATAWLLLFDPPGGESALAAAGAALATSTWALTFFAAVPQHRRLGDGFDPDVLARLLHANLIRTVAWAAHAGVCLALIASSS